MSSSNLIRATKLGGPAVRKGVPREVRPIVSTDRDEARYRVLRLYKAWYRGIPDILYDMYVPKSIKQCRVKMKEQFTKHKDVTDVRVIDLLIHRGQTELHSYFKMHGQQEHFMHYFRETEVKKPADFMSKFLDGN